MPQQSELEKLNQALREVYTTDRPSSDEVGQVIELLGGLIKQSHQSSEKQINELEQSVSQEIQQVQEAVNNLDSKHENTENELLDSINTLRDKIAEFPNVEQLIDKKIAEIPEQNPVEQAEFTIGMIDDLRGESRIDAAAIKNIEDNINADKLDLPEIESLDASKIKGLKELLPKHPPIFGGGSGATFLESLRDVDKSSVKEPSSGDVLTWNETKNKWDAQASSGGSSLTVEEQDGSPSVSSVSKIKVTNGDLTDDGSGTVSIDTSGSGSSVAGSDTQIQYNKTGSFGADANFTWDDGNTTLSVDGSAIFNESGNDQDFRVEGSTDANLLFADASTDRVGVGTNSPTETLDVRGNQTLNSNNLVDVANLGVGTDTVGGTPMTVVEKNGAGSSTVAEFANESPSPANDDEIHMQFELFNDASQRTEVTRVANKITDVTDGTEDGQLEFFTMSNGTLSEALRIHSNGTISMDGGTTSISSTELNLLDGRSALIDTAGDGLSKSTNTLDVDINGATSLGSSVAGADEVLVADSSDSNNIKKTTAQDIADLGSGGSAITLDLGDDGGNDSTDLTEIATTGDTNSIVTEDAADKMLIDMGQNWPTADNIDNGTISTSSNEILDANGNEILRFTNNASAVNELTVTNAATTNNPKLRATGDDANININITPKGTGKVQINSSYNFPNSDGTSGQALVTDGSGSLSFGTVFDTAGTGISASGSSISADEANIDHDSLQNFVSNEHVDHSSVSISGGTGISGGGDITTSRTLNLNAATSDLTDAASPNATAAGQLLIWDETATQFENSTLTAGSGISVTNADASVTVAADEANIDHDSLQNFDSAEHFTQSSITTTGTVTTGTWSADLASDTVDAIGEIASALRTGADTTLVTGTSGTSGNVMQWNADGDAVDSGTASSDIVTPSSTDTFTNKTFDANGTGNSLSNVEVADLASGAKSGGGSTLETEFSKSITIESPSDSEDLSMFFTNKAITVTEIRAVIRGSSTPSVTWTIRHNATDRSATGNEVVTGGTSTTSTTSGSDVTSFNDADIPADSFVWLETTAQSGTVDELNVTVMYTID